MSDVLVLAYHRDGVLHPVTTELITAARRIGEPSVALFGAGETPRAALAEHGVTTIHRIDAPEVTQAPIAVMAEALARLAREVDPSAVLIGNTPSGKEVAARLSIKLSSGLVTDAVGLRVEGEDIVVTKTVLSGDWTVDAVVTHGTPIITVKPGAVPARRAETPGAAVERTVDVQLQDVAPTTRVVEHHEKPLDGRPALADASIVVAGGRGTAGDFSVIEEFADAVGAAVGASRAAVDAGWYPHAAQIGQTGKQVSPQVYVAAGISGAVQHRAGMQTSRVVIAINSDDQAPILDIADLGIVGDLTTVLPQATAVIRAARG